MGKQPYPTMKLGLLFWILPFIYTGESSALVCYRCANEGNAPCAEVETCPENKPGNPVCVQFDFYTRHRDWKTIHSCGIEDPSRCGNGVACCNTDLCNGSSRTSSSSSLMIMMIPIILAIIYNQMV